MTESDGLLNKQQRKKARRKVRRASERQAHRNLDQTATEAITQALEAARALVSDLSQAERTLDVHLASPSEAEFVKKRINDALQIGEWLDDVRVVVADGEDDPNSVEPVPPRIRIIRTAQSG